MVWPPNQAGLARESPAPRPLLEQKLGDAIAHARRRLAAGAESESEE
jgi:hypothetical protein